MEQKRLILALILSSAILFLWSYFFRATPPQTNQPNSNQAAQTTAASPTPAASVQPQSGTTSAAVPQNVAPARTVTITTPLYQIKLDTRGGEPISWIIRQSKKGSTQTNIFSVAGTRSEAIPLELISPQGLNRQPRQVPLQLFTGDASIDTVLTSSTYRVEGVDSASGDVAINLLSGQKKQITLVLDDSSGLVVRKSLTFDADHYEVDLGVLLQRGGQNVPQAKLTIGPSIGDQGVKHHTFYSVAPEAVAEVNGKIERHPAAGINSNKSSPDSLAINGSVNWAAVGDTYFGMAAIPDREASSVEYRTAAYDFSANGKPEKRYLVTGYVPVIPDGGHVLIYAGPKDHYLLTDASAQIATVVHRPVDLEGLIDYGWLRWLSRPLAVPILSAINFLFRMTGSYGVAIILFTILVYSLFFPLKWRSSKAMKKAQKLAPRMKDLQERIKGMRQDDPRLKDLQMEQLRLMKEGNPLGGCLPLLIQMPFLFALYRAITISLDFRQATFLWLPDLSSGDPFHILEILMAGTMIVLQLITPAPSTDPVQRKMMAIGMPALMLYVLWGAPSGLLLYWLVGNIVGFSQQFLINRLTKSDDDEPVTPGPSGGDRRPKKTGPAAVASAT